METQKMKAKQTKFGLTVIFLMALAAWPGSARADGVTLTLSSVSGAVGSTITVDGTINNTGSAEVFLNSEDFTLGSAFLSNGDVTDFFLNAPLSLDGGASSGSIALFTLDIAPGTPGGSYGGNFLDIFGGPGSSDQNLLASAEFTVNVTSATSVSEPDTLSLAAMGLLALAAFILTSQRTPYALRENRPSV
jgi:hypothetical protein